MGDAPTILIIEDSKTQAKVLGNKLKDHGMEVLYAYDGLEGLQLAAEHVPDLIVLDMKMPKMSGVQVCQRLKRHSDTSAIPVLILSASDDSENTMAGLNAGAEDYIPKDIYAANYLLESLRSFGLIPVS